ncbi:MAG: hypothetical protein DMF74_00140 [Acidobacteria bacterium]|nr:MAG: hypothetical protein DMF74_00140 [Acidobacteriota bacterium]
MRHSFFCVAALCLLISLTWVAYAQTGPGAKATEPKNIIPVNSTTAKSEPKEDAEAARIIRERRANAQSLLMSLASDAGSFKDQRLRARTLARVADALWDTDPERGRTLFRRAWDAAETGDKESQQRLQEEIQQQKAKTGGNVAVSGPPDLRGEVLRLAARRDRALGEEFLGKLKSEKLQESTEGADKLKSNPLNASETQSQRLSLARQLLDTDVERALQFADPALGSITIDALDFLSYLRDRDAAAADRRYAAMLGMAAGNLLSDANTVSLLSSYLFTPHLFVTFSRNGGTSTQSTSRNNVAPEAPSELRQAFFRAAVEILLRPMAPPGQDQTAPAIDAKYLMLKRLLPLFEQYAPKETADAVRAEMEALASGLPENLRQRDDDSMRLGIRPPQSTEDREKALVDRIDRAKTSAERDQLYIQLARLYADSGDARAKDYVAKIEDTDLRNQVRAYIDGTMMLRAVDKKEIDRILELARNGELTHAQKAWALTQGAKLIGKTDQEKALMLLDDATAEARRIDASDADRPRALIAVASAYLIIDRPKAWDALFDAAKGANSAETFTGEDGVIRVSLITKGTSSIRSSSTRDFDIAPIFGELAHDDYNRAVELARLFEREAPRASATIAIARAVLEEKKK